MSAASLGHVTAGAPIAARKDGAARARLPLPIGALCATIALVTALAFAARESSAMPASPLPGEFTQPDGTRITLFLRGDEWQHWYEDVNGFTVVPDSGHWVYATTDAAGQVVPTSYLVGRVDPRAAGIELHLRVMAPLAARAQRARAEVVLPLGAQRSAAATGTVKNLVILCRFSDHTVAANGRDPAAYDSLFNQVNSTGFNAPTGSLRDFWYQASYNTLTIQSTVAAWVALPQSEAYYGDGLYGLPFGANKAPSTRSAAQMVRDACTALDPTLNFADFDTDNDGYVDAIDIIHSGLGGEQSGNGLNAIWSHKFSLSGDSGGVYVSADLNANAQHVRVDLYHTEPARFGNAGSWALTRVGVVAHETGHFFGLPDLYDTDGSSSGIGNWCLMANSWGWDRTQYYPPLPSAWCRVQLGWVTPTLVSATGTYSFNQSATSPSVGRINSGMGINEYLLIENREPVGFDQKIPQGGLAVWHIDDNIGGNSVEGYPGQAGWPANGNHFRVALLQADGKYNLELPTNVVNSLNNQGDAGDLFHDVPGMALSEATVPGSDRYAAPFYIPTGDAISNISAPGSTMSLYFTPSTWVDFAYGGRQVGTFSEPINTFGAAVTVASIGGRIVCRPGSRREILTVTKPLSVTSYQGTAIIGQ